MGYLFKTTCYPDEQSLNDAFYGDRSASVVAVPGGGIVVAEHLYTATGTLSKWNRCQRQFDATGTQTSFQCAEMGTRIGSAPACDIAEPFVDGVTIGWGIATAMVLAACVAYIKRVAR